MTSKTLYYVHDPMCSWCWGFEPVRRTFFSQIEAEVTIKRLVGGLAPDSSEPMPEGMQQALQQTWQNIQHRIPGTKFNFDFWSKCKPRRSTYPACRAVLAARAQGEEFDSQMTLKIQQAYYLQARNPSDDDTLIALAAELGLDTGRFTVDLNSEATHQQFSDEINFARSIGGDSFPSLFLAVDSYVSPLPLDYNSPEAMATVVRQLLAA